MVLDKVITEENLSLTVGSPSQTMVIKKIKS